MCVGGGGGGGVVSYTPKVGDLFNRLKARGECIAEVTEPEVCTMTVI